MPVQPDPVPTRAYVSLSELAEDVLKLSRARLYELIHRGAMPSPLYCIRSRRPIFDAELQRQALAVRRTGIGIDGSVVLFYRRDRQTAAAQVPTSGPSRRRASAPQTNRFTDLVSSLQSLGVSNADERSVTAAVAECFPNGIESQQESDVLRAVFRHLRRSQTA